MRLMPGAPDLIVKERHRNLHMDTRAVAGLAVRIHRPAMPDRLERGDPGLDDLAARLAIHRHHKTHPARGMLLGFGIHAVLGQPLAFGLLLGLPVKIQFRHRS